LKENLNNATRSKKEIYLLRAAKIIVPLALGAICLYYILTGFQWTEIWQAIQKADVFLFLTSSILTTIIFWFLRTLRWSVLLKNEPLDVPFFKLYLYTAVTVGFANFTPFQSGEALKVELFRKYGGTRLSGYNYFFLEKILDLLVISTLSVFGIFYLFEFRLGNHIQLAIVGLIGFLIILTAAFIFAARKYREKLRNFQIDFNKLFYSFLLTLMSWTVMIVGWKFIFQSAAIDLTIFQTMSVISLTTVIGIISFIPGAIGVSEISIAALLSQLGYKTVTAQTGAMMIALYSLVILILSFVHLIILKAKGH
jgi:uncharacterized membrane protein YbhN (UPF0104 family)